MMSPSDSFRGRNYVSWRALAGIIALILFPGTLGGVTYLIKSTQEEGRHLAKIKREWYTFISLLFMFNFAGISNGNLKFEKNGALNAFISDDGLLAQKKMEVPLTALVITNRHLKPNELFEIEVERNPKFVGNESLQLMAFGITNYPYADLATMTSDIKRIEWLTFWRMSKKEDESRPDVQNVYKKGLRMGMIVKENGTVHYFDDCIDQGERQYNLTGPVYGAVEFVDMGLQATIMDNSSEPKE